MAPFSANPLSLCVPDHAFETWLRDSGYLEILDDRAASAQSPPSSSPSSPPSPSSSPPPSTFTTTAPLPPPSTTNNPHRRAGKGAIRRIGTSVFSFVRTLLSILTLNPFAKLTAADFAGETPSWTVGFIGAGPSSQPCYSWPAGPAQARMRVQENVKRYARNYAFLTLLILACSLYQMPKSLMGLLTCLALWEGLRLCSDKWELEEKRPSIRTLLVHVTQLATAVVLYFCNLQIAVLCAISISYAVMIMHASLRKLSLSKQSVGASRSKRPPLKKFRS